jgi:hypothetical protein
VGCYVVLPCASNLLLWTLWNRLFGSIDASVLRVSPSSSSARPRLHQRLRVITDLLPPFINIRCFSLVK